MKAGRARGFGVVVLAATSLLATTAAATVRFGADDVRTVFHIGKSDDRNRVDYGIHLDARCMPVGDAPVYAYWHRFEPGEPPIGELNVLDQQVYGIGQQRVLSRDPAGSWTAFRIAAFRSLEVLIVSQRHDGGCIARARIPLHGRPAWVTRVFAQLSDGPFGGVSHVTFTGTDVDSQRPVSERREP